MHTSLERLRRTPRRYALALAGAYLLLGVAYIHSSGYIVWQVSPALEDMARLETIKGTAFIVVTAVLLYLLAHSLFRRAGRSAEDVVYRRESLLSTERRAMAGVIGMSMVHDFNNLLQSAAGNAELLQMDLEDAPDDIRLPLDALRESLERMQELAARIQAAGKHSVHVDRHTVDLAAFIRDSVMLMHQDDKVRSRNVQVITDGAVEVDVHPYLVRDAVLNIVLNAADAVRGDERIEVRVSTTERCGVIEVHDGGPGVDEADRKRIFEPYFSSKEGATGLGLLAVRTCAQAHGGSYDVRPSPLGGACFRLELPRARSGEA